MKSRTRALAIFVVTGLCLPPLAAADGHDQAFDQTFLSDYSQLETQQSNQGVEHFYRVPELFERVADYNGVMVDQPEILISAESKYKGGKPDDLAAIAELMREAVSKELTAGGYAVVNEPAPGIIYVRMALTDLELKKKKRGFLSFTPIGAIAHAAKDSGKEMMQKVDMTHVAVQAEFSDSVSGELLGALVAVRAGKKMRMEFAELDAMLTHYGARITCRLNNARTNAEQLDCLNLPMPEPEEK